MDSVFSVGDRVYSRGTGESLPAGTPGTILDAEPDTSYGVVQSIGGVSQYSNLGYFWTHQDPNSAETDMVNHPAHYTGHPTIEAIEVLEHVQDYRLGTAMKYLWRIAFGGKHDSVEDAKKAMWYIQRWLDKHDA